MMPRLTILQGDWIERLRELPDASFQMCVTSPPYWGLRNYGVKGQLGQEKTPEQFVDKVVDGFRELRRTLRDDGTLWLNLGDCYATGAGKVSQCPGGGPQGEKFKAHFGKHTSGSAPGMVGLTQPNRMPIPGLKPKDLIGVPWMVAFALRADGWYLRSEITWCKKVPMPESVIDRPTSATEKIFLLTKSPKYFYDADAVRNPPSESFANDSRWRTGSTPENEKNGYEESGAQNPKRLHKIFDKQRGHSRRHAGFNDRWDAMEKQQQQANGSNMRNFWLLGPEPYSEAHFATYPTIIPKRAILAGTSQKGCCVECGAPFNRLTDCTRTFESGSGKSGNEPVGKNGKHLQGGGETKDIRRGPVTTTTTVGWEPGCECESAKRGEAKPCAVIDPFGGSGTTGKVALELGRHCTLIELNPEYVELIEQRCDVTPGLPLA